MPPNASDSGRASQICLLGISTRSVPSRYGRATADLAAQLYVAVQPNLVVP